jgi:hypothetical protein
MNARQLENKEAKIELLLLLLKQRRLGAGGIAAMSYVCVQYLLDCHVVGVRTRGGPRPTSKMLRVPFLDGDARRTHGGLSWFGQKKALRPAEGGEICISLHRGACVGVTSLRERVSSPGLKGEKERVQDDCLRC